MKDFKGRVAVVTGAASGIGKGLARAAARVGMTLVIADLEEAALQRTAKELTDEGVSVRARRTDVSCAEDVEALADFAFAEHGAVHLLCNNAGVIAGRGAAWEITLDDWRWLVGVNLWGLVHGIRAFVPRMLEQDAPAHILNTGSIAGLVSSPGLAVYKATKHAVVSISETLHHDLRAVKAKIGVSVLCPAGVETHLSEAARNRPANLADATEPDYAAVVQHRDPSLMKSPDEIANLAFDAVREGRFYVLTHPSSEVLVDHRIEDLRLRQNPSELPRRS